MHGLAWLVSNDLLPPHISQNTIIKRIEEIISGTRVITHDDGSLDEILPLESSYCVTALVAFDILSALRLLGQHLSASTRDEHVETVRPLISFIQRAREHHGVITNHMAAGAGALALWQATTGENVASSSIPPFRLSKSTIPPRVGFLSTKEQTLVTNLLLWII